MLAFLGALLKRSRSHTAFMGLLTIFSFVPTEGKIKTDGNYYCGIFNSTETNGASGYFTILISKEEASEYTVQLDLSEFSSTCDLYRTVRYIPAEAPLIITTDYGMFLLLKPALLGRKSPSGGRRSSDLRTLQRPPPRGVRKKEGGRGLLLYTGNGPFPCRFPLFI